MMEFIAESMFNITLSMSTIILVMLLFSRIISKKLTAQCRYLLWCLIILRLAVPAAGLHFMTPIFTITIPETVTYEENLNDGIRENDLHSYDRMPTSETKNILEWQEIGDEPVISYPPQSPSESLTEKMVPDTERFSEREKNQTALESSLPNVDDPIQSPMTIDITRILRGVMLIWMTVAVGNFAFRMASYRCFVLRMRRHNKACTDEQILAVYHALCSEQGIKRLPRLCMNDSVVSPMVYGLVNPIIILPYGFEDEFALRGILLHELVHYRRGDLYMKLIAQLALSLHWFNPFVYAAVDRFAQASELACDERVLATYSMSDRVDYGNVMLAVIKQGGEERMPRSSMSTHFNPHIDAVKERFRNILDMRPKNFARWLVVLLALICVIAGTLAACSFGGEDDRDEEEENKKIENEVDESSNDEIEKNEGNVISPDANSLGGVDDNVLHTGYFDLSQEAMAKLSAISKEAGDLFEDGRILMALQTDENRALSVAAYRSLSKDGQYLVYRGDDRQIFEEYPSIKELVPKFDPTVSNGINATLICDSEQIMLEETHDESAFFEQGWLYLKGINNGTTLEYRLPIGESNVPDLDIASNTRFFTYNGNSAFFATIPGREIGGEEDALYVFVSYNDNGSENWYVTALCAPDICTRGATYFDGYGNLVVQVICEGTGNYQTYLSYDDGLRFVMVEDLNEEITVEVKTEDEQYSVLLNGNAYATLCDMLRFALPVSAEKLNGNYILVKATAGDILLQPQDTLYEKTVSAFLYHCSRRRYIGEEWQYSIDLPAGKSSIVGQLALRWNPGNASGEGWSSYDMTSGDGAGYEEITFCESGVVITFDMNHRDVKYASSDSLYSVLCALAERGERLTAAEADAYHEELRCRVMLYADGRELLCRLTFADEDHHSIWVQTEEKIRYDDILSYLQLVVGDAYSRFDSFDELIAAQDEAVWQEKYEYATLPPIHWQIEYLTAIKSGNSAKLEKICGNLVDGMYDSYRSLKFADGDYYEILHLGDYNKPFFWHVTITESEVDGLPAGDYVFRLVEGGFAVQLINTQAESIGISSASVNSDFNTWFGTCGIYEIPAWGDWDNSVADGRLLEYAYPIAFDYLSCRYGMLTKEEINDYGYRAFGIESLFSHLRLDENSYECVNDKYGISGHGGEVWSYTVSDYTSVGESVSVSVQFWADWSKTIASHKITYHFGVDVPDHGELAVDRLVGITYESRSEFEPAHTSM